MKTRIQKLRKVQDRLAALLVAPSLDPGDESMAGNARIEAAISDVGQAIEDIMRHDTRQF